VKRHPTLAPLSRDHHHAFPDRLSLDISLSAELGAETVAT
jgi:hypothetical protein